MARNDQEFQNCPDCFVYWSAPGALFDARRAAPESRDVPETALDIVKLLTSVAILARAGGWKVHMAMEAGEDQSVTFSASLWTKPLNDA